MSLIVCLYIYVYICLSVLLSVCLPAFLPSCTFLPSSLPVYLPYCLQTHLPVNPPACMLACMNSCRTVSALCLDVLLSLRLSFCLQVCLPYRLFAFCPAVCLCVGHLQSKWTLISSLPTFGCDRRVLPRIFRTHNIPPKIASECSLRIISQELSTGKHRRFWRTWNILSSGFIQYMENSI
jgi:hypothetical protein